MSEFVPRFEIPDEYTDPLYRTLAGGGYNPCIEGNRSVSPHVSGSVLANCVGYSWGRFCEVNGLTYCKLSTADAGYWFGNLDDGYERGTEPRLGAVACFTGHVCNVEEIIDDDTIITSDSNWPGPKFMTATRTRANGWNRAGGSLSFMGFIYPPNDFDKKKFARLIPLLIGGVDNGSTIII